LRHAGKRLATAVVALLACSAAAACSLLLDTSADQCTPESGCTGKFAGMQCVDRVCVASDGGGGDADSDAIVDAGPWGCLGNVTIDAAPSGEVNVIVPLVDLTSQQGLQPTDVFARICAKIDVNCNSPLASGDAGIILNPDANGLLHLTLPAGFDGFVLIDPIVPPSDAGDAAPPPNVFVPSLVFFNPPIDHDLVYSVIVMVKTSELVEIATTEQTPIDPSLGAVFMETVDCTSKPSAGVSVVIDSQTSTTQGFYFKGGLPALNASSTDQTGYAGFVNAPLGTRTVTGTLQSTQEKIGSATVFTKASTISYTTMAPSP
jgi:hypothetical protein